MEDISVRKFGESDLKEIIEVFKKTFRNIGEDWSDSSSLQHVKENINDNYCYLAEVNGNVVGMMLASIQTRVKGPELFIDTFAVLPEYQKKGIGQKLMDISHKIVKDEGLVGISLLANPELESFDWYKKEGMKESGWVELYKIESSS